MDLQYRFTTRFYNINTWINGLAMIRLRPSTNILIQLISLPILALIISGCASITAQDCLNADWRVAGYQDGAKGEKETRAEFYQQACSKFNVAVDTSSYSKGHADGILAYCLPSNGSQVGLKGKEYRGVCPTELEADFLPAYEHGKNIHRLKEELKTAKRELKKSKKKLKAHTKSLDKKQAALEQASSEQKPTESLLKETAQLTQEKKALEEKISQLNQSIGALDSEIKTLMQVKWD